MFSFRVRILSILCLVGLLMVWLLQLKDHRVTRSQDSGYPVRHTQYKELSWDGQYQLKFDQYQDSDYQSQKTTSHNAVHRTQIGYRSMTGTLYGVHQNVRDFTGQEMPRVSEDDVTDTPEFEMPRMSEDDVTDTPKSEMTSMSADYPMDTKTSTDNVPDSTLPEVTTPEDVSYSTVPMLTEEYSSRESGISETNDETKNGVIKTSIRKLSEESENDSTTVIDRPSPDDNNASKSDIDQIHTFNDVIAEQEKRLHHISDVCKGRGGIFRTNHTGKFVEFNTLINSKQNVVFCQIQKVGSTSWKRIIEFADNKRIRGYKTPYDVHFSDFSMTRLGDFNGSRTSLNKRSFKFMFVRDPYERLFSGYLDKLYAPNVVFWKNLGSFIQTLFRSEEKRSKCGSDVTFEEFVKYVIYSETYGTRWSDKHFSPQYKHCQPCIKKYDFIGKMESFDTDASYVIDKIESLSNVHIPFFKLKTISVRDTVHDMALRMYHPKSRVGIKRCESMYVGMQRIWRNLQIRGILSTNAKMPFTKKEADQIPMKAFEYAVYRIHKTVDTEKFKKRNKLEAMREAFGSLSEETISRLKHVFRLDFKLFRYDPNSEKLFNYSRVNTNFKYFKPFS